MNLTSNGRSSSSRFSALSKGAPFDFSVASRSSYNLSSSDTISNNSQEFNKSTTTQTLRDQFANKVRQSSSELDSKAIMAKLEEQSVTLHKLHFDCTKIETDSF